jgi:hypothetical protein
MGLTYIVHWAWRYSRTHLKRCHGYDEFYQPCNWQSAFQSRQKYLLTHSETPAIFNQGKENIALSIRASPESMHFLNPPTIQKIIKAIQVLLISLWILNNYPPGSYFSWRPPQQDFLTGIWEATFGIRDLKYIHWIRDLLTNKITWNELVSQFTS